jgi:glycosyltransferase involved in cell wall biosynthesis
MRRERLDILQLNSTQDLNLGVLARMVSKNTLRLVHTQHMQFGAKKTDLLHRLQHARLEAWVAPLPWLAEQTGVFTTIPADRIHIIPFGIDLSVFERRPSPEEARRQFGLPADGTVVGVVGRLDRGKGQEYLLRAAARLRDEGRRLHILLVGEDTRGEVQGYGDELRRLADELAIDDQVTFSGFHEQVTMAYAAMDCFVLTSLSETYGMVTIEAMAAGLPIIGTNTAGTPEILAGDSGMLLPPRDPAALAEALERLLRDPQEMKALGNRARRAALARFSHHTQCRRYEELFMQFQTP